MGLEVADNIVELLEALETTAEDVDVLRVGDVGDVAETDGNVLDEDLCLVDGGTELSKRIVCVVDGVDDVVFPHALERAVVVVALLLF